VGVVAIVRDSLGLRAIGSVFWTRGGAEDPASFHISPYEFHVTLPSWRDISVTRYATPTLRKETP